MYRVLLKTAIVDALTQTFDSNFPNGDFTGTYVAMEYPLDRQHYPGIWVNYEDQDSLTIAGINHREYVLDDPNNPASPMHEVTRWLFSGEVTLTIVALSSAERDRLYDEFVRIFAFSRLENASVDFRDLIESNPFLAIQMNWDELRPHGDAASPGTPWGTENEVIYETSIGFDVEGEFISDPATNTLTLLEHIVVQGYDSDVSEVNPAFALGIPRV